MYMWLIVIYLSQGGCFIFTKPFVALFHEFSKPFVAVFYEFSNPLLVCCVCFLVVCTCFYAFCQHMNFRVSTIG